MTTQIHQLRCEHSSEEQSKVVVPVAGVCNAEIGRLSMAGLGYRKLRNALIDSDVPVTRPITPEKLGLSFGLRDSIDDVYNTFSRQVDAVLAPYGHNVQPLFLAHSFGGLLALRDYAARKSAGIVTAGTPHAGMSCLPLGHLVPDRVKNYLPYSRWCRQAAHFSAETFDMLKHPDQSDRIIFMGSTHDRIVQAASSLPAMPGVRRILFGTDIEPPEELTNVEYIQTSPVRHNALISHPEATGFIVHSIVKMIDPLAFEAVPDNVVYPQFGSLQTAF